MKPTDVTFRADGFEISRISEVMILGVIIDEKLTGETM